MKNLFSRFFFICVAGLLCTFSSAAEIDDYRKRAEQGDATAQFMMGIYSSYSKNYSEAEKWLRASAEQGNTQAQNSLGSMYQAGEGIEKNYGLAMAWYKKAADQGLPIALNNLGYLYDLGLGVAEDNKRAVELYTQAAEKGYIKSMLNLGLIYANGELGIQQDLVEAFKWYDLLRFYTQNSENMKLKWQVRGLLDELKNKMTAEQISKAEIMTREWDASHRKQ